MALASRLAIIPGGMGGIGSVTGKLLRGHGSKLALLYAPFEASKVASSIKETYGEDSDDIRPYECDITSPSSVKNAFASIEKENAAFPAFLINSAGYVTLSPLEDTSPEEIQRHFNINLFGPTLTGQAFARMYFAARQKVADTGTKPYGGRIVNIASQAAHIALHLHGVYCASKAGVIGLTRSQASEWGPRGITANSISPGPVWTQMGKDAWADREAREAYQASVPTGEFAEPDEVARIVEFLVLDKALNINGADIRLDGGYTVR
ncbi:hypothetical protein LTR78_006469 [Recurvomyces mirabilis]|uniref:Uncharacterized protein n=1 Tax=Recurvomyces mirabilis TaxID=574656 RepID=A0AAE1BZS2_9PEZI|nr:hypothetical protein LTR78_006469 [Recurvomyces mirabilis]KAK5151112.1 hypothetical protein LTS14_009608 [Recurvomyces mirabilis]